MNGYWARYTLREAGLRIQLGHDGLSCPRPRHKKTPITIIDLNGIQDVHVDYCDCRAGREHVQLLRNAWWPATPHRPRTAITFRLLKSFHVLNLIGKVNIYDYYRSLEQLVDPTGTRGVKVCTRPIYLRNCRLNVTRSTDIRSSAAQSDAIVIYT